MKLFLLQMAGPPGIGKSTVARLVCSKTQAVCLDADVVKSSLLRSEVPWGTAGPATYSVMFAVADDCLASGRSVIIDSPSHYREVVDNGQSTSAARRASYAYVELVTSDLPMLQGRMRAREPRLSQMIDLDTWPAGGSSRARRTGAHSWENVRPDDVPVLTLCVTVDTSPEDLAHDCLRYLAERTGAAT